jgi:hypothetical protein
VGGRTVRGNTLGTSSELLEKAFAGLETLSSIRRDIRCHPEPGNVNVIAKRSGLTGRRCIFILSDLCEASRSAATYVNE